LPKGAVGLDEDGEPIYLSRRQKKQLKDNLRTDKQGTEGTADDITASHAVAEINEGGVSQDTAGKEKKRKEKDKKRKDDRDKDREAGEIHSNSVEGSERRGKSSRKPRDSDAADKINNKAPGSAVRIMRRGDQGEVGKGSSSMPAAGPDVAANSPSQATERGQNSRHARHRPQYDVPQHSQDGYFEQPVDGSYQEYGYGQEYQQDYYHSPYGHEGYQQEYTMEYDVYGNPVQPEYVGYPAHAPGAGAGAGSGRGRRHHQQSPQYYGQSSRGGRGQHYGQQFPQFPPSY
jgi:hypothetical protein